MTLILTEISKVGVIMAADSVITYEFDKKTGRPIEKSDRNEKGQTNWQKLLKVPSIRGGISYWGTIGAITRNLPLRGKDDLRFDHWLKNLIDKGNYTDLSAFADYLADELNAACSGKTLKNDEKAGIHVAGYYKWSDGIRRPTFFHVHNGHLADPRKPFEKHQDFPFEGKPIEFNIAFLENGNSWVTRNGDFTTYAVIWKQMELAFINLNQLGITIPKYPSRLSSRRSYLHMAIEVMMRIYQCSSKGRTIGGVVSSLAIGADGYLSDEPLLEPICPACDGTGRIRKPTRK